MFVLHFGKASCLFGSHRHILFECALAYSNTYAFEVMGVEDTYLTLAAIPFQVGVKTF